LAGVARSGSTIPRHAVCWTDTTTFSGRRARLDSGISSQQHPDMGYSNFVCLATDGAAAVSVVEIQAFIKTEGILAVIIFAIKEFNI
jgi:hypothetical protein